MTRVLIALALAICAAVAAPAGARQGPDVIPLPKGFGPEGITTAGHDMFFVSSRLSGAIYRGSLRTGDGRILVPAVDGREATGIKVDRRGRLFVSGAGSNSIRVYDARTGRELMSYDVPEEGFINDVVLTRDGAYFTDSIVPTLYFLPFGRKGALPDELERIPISGDLVYGPGFNANGIEAARGGRTLILVKSSTGELFTADPATGRTRRIDLGAENVANGDGILLEGRTLYVVRNRDNLVAVVQLRRDLTAGDVVRTITDSDFAVPTTIARSGGRLYVVNAKFGQEGPDTPYEVVKVPGR